MLALLKLLPLRDWLYLALALALGLGLLTFGYHERQVARDEMTAELVKQQAATQKSIDDAAESQNARIEAKFAAHQYVPIDYTLPVGCTGSVSDDVRNAVNKAHKP